MAFNITQEDINDRLGHLRDLNEEELDALFAEEEAQIEDGHLVEYLEECVRHTEDTERDRMRLDELLWEAHENVMRELQLKDDWQAKITTNEPFTTTYQAKMLVRRAVIDKPDWFDLDSDLKGDPAVDMKLAFWKDALKAWSKKSRFHELYPDMAEMSFAVGISLAMKAIWKQNPDGTEGLTLARIEPWKLRRDPDAMTREPQSGLYCIHQDWVDYHVLLEGEKAGYFINVRDCLHEQETESPYGRRDERKRRGLIDRTHRFRPQVYVREFWGDVLDHNGELALSGVRYTVANRTVISRPIRTNFPTLRWPIHQFAALPHLRNFHGISIIEGMLKIWKLRNNIINMTADQLSFVLNSAYEVDEHKLQNPSDKELYPGAMKSKKANATGSAYTLIGTNKDFLPVADNLLNVTGNIYQNGTFVTELVRGEAPAKGGTQRTLGEIEIKTNQAMGVFEGISHDVEFGGEQALRMIQEVLTTYWDPWDQPSYIQMLGQKHARILGRIAFMTPEQRIDAVRQDTDVQIRGISILFQKSGLIDRLMNMAKLTDSDRFRMYAKDDVLIRKIADTLDATETIKTREEMEHAVMSGGMPGMPMPGAPAPPGSADGGMGAGGAAPSSSRPPGELGNELMERALKAARVTSTGVTR